jgi:hypothetical protein
MAHWFDGFTMQLAVNGDRRSFLETIGAAMGAGLLPNGSAFAQARPAAPLPARAGSATSPAAAAGGAALPSGQTKRVSGNLLIEERSVTKGDLTLQVQLAFNRATHNATSTMTISRAAAVVARIDATAAPKGGAASASMTFGPAVSGIQKATIATKNGSTLQGTVDGRAFSASGSPKQPSQIRFADGRPPPQVVIDRPLSASIEELVTEGKKAFAEPVTRAPMSLRRSAVTRVKGPKFRRFIPQAPGLDWFEPSNDVVDCTVCEDDCGKAYAAALPGLIVDIFCPPCYLADVAAQLAIWAGCMLVCQLPHGGCLPTPCGTFTTCGKNDKCFSFQGGSLCCPAPAALCKNICCGTDVTTCAPDGGCGCTTDQTACGNDCCDAGQTCINGVCCDQPNVTVCNGVCCAPGQVCHNGKCCRADGMCGNACCDEISNCADPKTGVCCSFAAVVCGTQCCPLGAHCINGKCCDANSVCGNICCPSGQTCSDPVNHKCTSCSGKTVPCLPPEGAGLCCPSGVACCAGTCCQPGQVCNFTGVVNGKNTYACGAPSRIQ